MSMTTTTRLIHPWKRHPLTGRPIESVGVLPSGRIVWQQMGGDDTVEPAGGQQAPQRPDGVSEEEWNALGDPGKAAIVREREARQEAERQLAAARARPTPPTQQQGGQPAGGQQPPAQPTNQSGGAPDIEKIVQQAVAAAIQPFEQREQQRAAQEAAVKVQNAVVDAAKDVLHDGTDALANIDLTKVVDDQGQADPAKVKAELDALVQRKPHLAKSHQRFAPPGIGGGAPAHLTDADKVKAVLADMQKATGVRPAPTN